MHSTVAKEDGGTLGRGREGDLGEGGREIGERREGDWGEEGGDWGEAGRDIEERWGRKLRG